MTIDLSQSLPSSLSKYSAALAKDIIDGGPNLKWWIKSAFHKELRRGDFERGLRFANWFALIHSDYTARNYCKGIVFEETRNLVLNETIGKTVAGHDLATVAAMMIGTKKKWESDVRGGPKVFDPYALSYVTAVDKGAPTRAEAEDVFRSSDDLYEMMEMCWRVFWIKPIFDDGESVIIDTFIERAARTGGDVERYSKSVFNRKSHHYQKIFCEMFAGLWDEKCNEFTKSDVVIDEAVMTLPYLHTYVFDNHTRPGWTVYRHGLHRLLPGVPPPTKLDARFSGMTMGICWREYARAQFGDSFRNVAWESVEIPDTVWAASYAADFSYYPKLYSSNPMVP